MNDAIRKGNIGEWALQSVAEEMKTDNGNIADVVTDADVAQRTAGKKRYRNGHLQNILTAKTKRL